MSQNNEELHQRVEWNMTNHAPEDETVIHRFEAIRVLAKDFSHGIIALCPDGRDRALALTHAEDALMRAVAAIARDQEGDYEFAEIPAMAPRLSFEDSVVPPGSEGHGEPVPEGWDDPSGLSDEEIKKQRDEEAEMAGVVTDAYEPPFKTSEDLETSASEALEPRVVLDVEEVPLPAETPGEDG